MRAIKYGLILCIAVFAQSCATYTATPFDRAANDVESIVLMDALLPEKPIAYQGANTSMAMGILGGFGGALVGGAIDASIHANRQKRLMAIIEEKEYDAEDRFRRALLSAVSARGYDISLLSAERPKQKFFDQYPELPDRADASLDVVALSYGYNVSSGNYPHLHVIVRLVDASGKTLMENQVAYNPIGKIKGIVTIDPNPSYVFKDVDAMEENPNLVIAGLDDAFLRVAAVIAGLLE